MKLYLKPPIKVEVLPDGVWEVECASMSQRVKLVPTPLSAEELAELEEEEIEEILREAAPPWPDINV